MGAAASGAAPRATVLAKEKELLRLAGEGLEAFDVPISVAALPDEDLCLQLAGSRRWKIGAIPL